MITAIDLANAFVDGYAKSDYLTNVKLNKLVYFAYARYLKKGEVLFSEPIQAWKFGPVIPDVYHAYKKYGRNQITQPLSKKISDESCKIADEIWQDFGKLTDWDLMELIHLKDSAWSKSYTDKCNVLITDTLYCLQKTVLHRLLKVHLLKLQILLLRSCILYWKCLLMLKQREAKENPINFITFLEY